MKIHHSWRLQLFVFVEVVLALLAAALLWYINTCLFDLLLRYNEENQMKTLQYVEGEMSAECARVEELSGALLANQEVQKFFSGSYGMDKEGVLLRREIIQNLDSQMQSNSALHSIAIRTSDGAEIHNESNYTLNSAGQTWKLSGGQDKWCFREMPVRLGKNAAPAYLLSYTATYQSLRRELQITLSLDERKIRSIYQGFLEDGQSAFFICDQKGMIITASSPEKTGTDAGELLAQMEDPQQGSFIFGNRDQVVYLSMPGLGWVIVKQMPVEHFRRDIDHVQTILIWVLVVSVLVLNLLLFFGVKQLSRPLQSLKYAMRQVQDGRLGYQIGEVYRNEFDDITRTFNDMSSSISALVRQNRIKEEQKQLYALSALRAQINPHFLFNTINTIKWMAISQQATHIKSALDRLLVLLRPLFKETTDEITLQEELEYVSNYICLVNLRFGGNITIAVNIPQELLARKIPCFILQPMIENSISHGFQGDYSQAAIAVSCEEQEDCLLLTVHDNGSGIPEERLSKLRSRLENPEPMLQNGDKLGLPNVNLRIQLKYGREYGVTLASDGLHGTDVHLRLPRIE